MLGRKDELRAVLGLTAPTFPDRCVRCAKPAAERKPFSWTFRYTAVLKIGPPVTKTREVAIDYALSNVPYCTEHANMLAADKESNRGFAVRLQTTGINLQTETASVRATGVVFTFEDADYAALFRAANKAPTPSDWRRSKRAKAVSDLRKGFSKHRGVLQRYHEQGNVEGIVEYLSHKKPDARQAALGVLGFHMDDEHARVARGTIVQLSGDPDDGVRASAVYCLAKLRPADEELLGIFLSAAEDPAATVRRSAAVGLGSFPDPRAVEALGNLLDDEDTWCRRWAVEALAKLGEMGRETLTLALDDEDENIVRIAREALGT